VCHVGSREVRLSSLREEDRTLGTELIVAMADTRGVAPDCIPCSIGRVGLLARSECREATSWLRREQHPLRCILSYKKTVRCIPCP
jgi:hypothetical protein